MDTLSRILGKNTHRTRQIKTALNKLSSAAPRTRKLAIKQWINKTLQRWKDKKNTTKKLKKFLTHYENRTANNLAEEISERKETLRNLKQLGSRNQDKLNNLKEQIAHLKIVKEAKNKSKKSVQSKKDSFLNTVRGKVFSIVKTRAKKIKEKIKNGKGISLLELMTLKNYKNMKLYEKLKKSENINLNSISTNTKAKANSHNFITRFVRQAHPSMINKEIFARKKKRIEKFKDMTMFELKNYKKENEDFIDYLSDLIYQNDYDREKIKFLRGEIMDINKEIKSRSK